MAEKPFAAAAKMHSGNVGREGYWAALYDMKADILMQPEDCSSAWEISLT